jgi:hypothetical protein
MFELDALKLPTGTSAEDLEAIASLLAPHGVTLDTQYGPIPLARNGKTYQLYRGTYDEKDRPRIEALPYVKQLWADPRAGPWPGGFEQR